MRRVSLPARADVVNGEILGSGVIGDVIQSTSEFYELIGPFSIG